MTKFCLPWRPGPAYTRACMLMIIGGHQCCPASNSNPPPGILQAPRVAGAGPASTTDRAGTPTSAAGSTLELQRPQWMPGPASTNKQQHLGTTRNFMLWIGTPSRHEADQRMLLMMQWMDPLISMDGCTDGFVNFQRAIHPSCSRQPLNNIHAIEESRVTGAALQPPSYLMYMYGVYVLVDVNGSAPPHRQPHLHVSGVLLHSSNVIALALRAHPSPSAATKQHPPTATLNHRNHHSFHNHTRHPVSSTDDRILRVTSIGLQLAPRPIPLCRQAHKRSTCSLDH